MSGAVCVTGASGYLASYLIKLLLERGYTVRASVRDQNDPMKTKHLLSLHGAEERLRLCEADLLREGSFDSVVDGCEAVFHTASPVNLSPSDPKVELIDPAVKGTINVLRSCAKNASLKRVVLTSSITALVFNGKPLRPDVVVDESWFSDHEFCEQSKLWYPLSKILAEESAWEFARANEIDLVVINPGFVIGPFVQPELNLTTSMILNLINAQTYPNSVHRFVDIRDVSLAHIQALEVSSAKGRHCLVGNVVHISEALDILRQLYPSLSFPDKCEDEVEPPKLSYQISKDKAIDSLGVKFTPLEVSLRDTVEALREKGFLKL